MKAKKNILLKIFAFILLVLTILTGCSGAIMSVKNTVNNFSKLLEVGNLENLTLTIYYVDPHFITRIPLSADSLIRMAEADKIIVHGNVLGEHIDLLKQLNVEILIPAEHDSVLNARLVYTFEWDDDILTVVMGIHDSVFINGLEIESNAVFFDIIRPFLTEDSLEMLAIFFMQNI